MPLHRPLSRLLAGPVRVPPLLLLHLRVYVDVLGFLEGFQSLASQLPPYAATFLATEGGGVVVRQWVVDPDGAGPDLAHALEHLLEVPRVDVGPEPIRDGVGLLDGLFQATDLDHGYDRPEGLVPHHR